MTFPDRLLGLADLPTIRVAELTPSVSAACN